MKIINLGGVGGCDVTHSIQQVIEFQERYPYDWLLSNQSFVIRTFMNNSSFFDFEKESDLVGKEFRVKERDALSVHDFNETFPYTKTKQLVKEKYARRFSRLNDVLWSKESILFVRKANNTPQCEEWNDRYLSEPDDYELWKNFVEYVKGYFNKPVYLLILTESEEEYQKNQESISENLFIRRLNKKSETDIETQMIDIISEVYNTLL